MAFRPFLLVALLLAGPGRLASRAAEPSRVLVNVDRQGLALQGYDPVAYFADQRPVKGDPKFTSVLDGATYRFASAEHKRLFDGDPRRYEPAFGGYCGYAASINRLSPISPEWFQVLDGRLVLQHNRKAWDRWNEGLPGNLVKADGNWPGLVARNGIAGGRTLQHLDRSGVALGGYDPLTYFVDGAPQKGDRTIQATYHGALYHFVSQVNRERFESDPARYAPAYGGFCGYAASIGKVRPANPLLWSIVEGQLIVQHTRGAVELWERDVAGNKARADRNWPRLVEAKAGARNPIDSLLGKSVLADAN